MLVEIPLKLETDNGSLCLEALCDYKHVTHDIAYLEHATKTDNIWKIIHFVRELRTAVPVRAAILDVSWSSKAGLQPQAQIKSHVLSLPTCHTTNKILELFLFVLQNAKYYGAYIKNGSSVKVRSQSGSAATNFERPKLLTRLVHYCLYESSFSWIKVQKQFNGHVSVAGKNKLE